MIFDFFSIHYMIPEFYHTNNFWLFYWDILTLQQPFYAFSQYYHQPFHPSIHPQLMLDNCKNFEIIITFEPGTYRHRHQWWPREAFLRHFRFHLSTPPRLSLSPRPLFSASSSNSENIFLHYWHLLCPQQFASLYAAMPWILDNQNFDFWLQRCPVFGAYHLLSSRSTPFPI